MDMQDEFDVWLTTFWAFRSSYPPLFQWRDGFWSWLECSSYPVPTLANLVVEPDNSVVVTDTTLEYSDCSFMVILAKARHEQNTIADMTFSCSRLATRWSSVSLVRASRVSVIYFGFLYVYEVAGATCCAVGMSFPNPKDVNTSVLYIKMKRTIPFVDWCPVGAKKGPT